MSAESRARPGAAVLGALAVLAVLELGWAGFQWSQLVSLSSGGEIYCGLSSLGDCAAVWDSPFARGVRAWTGLPVAAWGVVWGFAALALPAAVWLRARARQGLEPLWSATLVTALLGAVGSVVLVAASAQFGAVCTNCVVTYALVLAYAAVAAIAGARRGSFALPSGGLFAAAPLVLGYLLVLYPALQTPSPADAGELVRSVAEGPRDRAPAAERAPERREPGPPSIEDVDLALGRMISQLDPMARQQLANALEEFRRAPDVPVRPTRGRIGSPTARVQLTEFADLLCVHCAELHKTLELLRTALPEGAFSIEPRYFPLDGRCNALLQPGSGPATRCVAAKAMICAAGHPRAFELAGELFERRTAMTPEQVYATAAPILPEDELRACIESPETQAKLQEDIAWAEQHGIQGTPLVLLNGKAVPGNMAVLYALLLAGGNPDHPAFSSLPGPVAAPKGEG